MSTCTSSPHPMVSTSYHSLAGPPSRARAIAPFGGEPGILFSPFFGNADAARPLPTSCAAHARCYHTTALPTTSDERVVAPHRCENPRHVRQAHAFPPCCRRARKRWIFYDSRKDQQKYSSHHGRMRVRGDGACPVLKAGMRMVVQVLPGQEGSNEPTRSLGGPLLPSQSPATGRMAYRIQKWSISTQLFTRRR